MTISDPKSRMMVIRAWAPVLVWIMIVLFLGATPALFQRYRALVKPFLVTSGKTALSRTPPSSEAVPSSIRNTLKQLARAAWRRVRPLLARVLLDARIMERLGHFVIYLGLGLLARRAHRISPFMPGTTALIVIMASVAAVDETLQRWTPLRSSTVDDWIVDVFGICAGAALYQAYNVIRAATRKR